MTNKTANKFSPEVRERAVRMVFNHEAEHPSRWTAILSIAAKIECSGQTLNEWTKRSEIDAGRKAEVTTDEGAKLKALERENRELRQANEILRKASAYIAQAPLANAGVRLSGKGNSTARSSDDRDDRRASSGARGRVDLLGVADRPIDVSRSCRQAGRTWQTVGAGTA